MEKYRQPLIVAIAKFDVLQQGLGIVPGKDDYLYYDEDKLEYSLNLQNVTNMSFLLREKLLEIAPEFVSAVEGFSETVYFVPVSSFGCSPKVIGGNDGKTALGIIPGEMKPFWTEVPFLLHLYLHGLIPGVNAMPENVLELERYKFSSDIVTFSFPGVKARYELPKIYWGTALYCKENGSYYRLPVPGNYSAARSCAASTLDEQIDTDFWNQQ